MFPKIPHVSNIMEVLRTIFHIEHDATPVQPGHGMTALQRSSHTQKATQLSLDNMNIKLTHKTEVSNPWKTTNR